MNIFNLKTVILLGQIWCTCQNFFFGKGVNGQIPYRHSWPRANISAKTSKGDNTQLQCSSRNNSSLEGQSYPLHIRANISKAMICSVRVEKQNRPGFLVWWMDLSLFQPCIKLLVWSHGNRVWWIYSVLTLKRLCWGSNVSSRCKLIFWRSKRP